MKEWLSLLRRNCFFSAGIILSLIIVLVSSQVVWLQDNIYNRYKTVFDSPPFRIGAGVFLGILIGMTSIRWAAGFSSKDEKKALRKLFIVCLPLCFTILLPFRIETGYINLFNSILFASVLFMVYVLSEVFFLIPLSRISIREKWKHSRMICAPIETSWSRG